MCFPMAGMLFGALGSIVSAAGAAASASAQASQASYNAEVERINARTRMQQGVAEAEKVGRDYRRLQGQQIAAAGKSGLDPGSGSLALVVNQETPKNEFLDTMNTLWSATSEANARQNRAKDFDAQAKAYRQSAGISFASGIAGGLGKALKIA